MKKPKSRFHHGSLRDAAIQLATLQVEKEGFAALSLERIAQKLGVTRPALYRHFKDRRALLQAVAQPIFVRFEAGLTDAFFSKKDPWEALTAVWLAYLHFAVANPGWFRLQFTAPAKDRPMPDLEAAPARYFPAIQAALREEFGEDYPEIDPIYVGGWGIAHGISMLAVEKVLDIPNVLKLHERALELNVQAVRAYAEKVRRSRKSKRAEP